MRFVKRPYLQLPETDGMTVMWETDAPGSTLLRVWDCDSPAIPDTYVCENRPVGEAREFFGEAGITHRADAAGLLPDTDYCYQAVSMAGEELAESEVCVMRTAPLNGAAFRVAFLAETGCAAQPGNVPAIAREAALARPDIVIFMGDAVWDGNIESDWNELFFEPLGELFSNTPFYHVMGNHDSEGRGITSRIFAAPPCHSFAYAGARFIIIDATRFARRSDCGGGASEMRAFDTFDESDPQWRFLEEELSKADEKWKFVCMHYPPYASSLFEAPCMRRLCPLFEKYGVDAVFTSHTLHYERSHPLIGGVPDPDGTVYFTTGGIGDYPQWVRHKTLGVTAKIMPKPHFIIMDVTAFGIDVMAYDSRGALFDIWSKR